MQLFVKRKSEIYNDFPILTKFFLPSGTFLEILCAFSKKTAQSPEIY